MSNPVHTAGRKTARLGGRKRFWLCWLLAIGGCMPAGEENGSGPGKRSQTLSLTPEQELEVGRRAYREVLGEVRDRILPSDHPEVALSRRVTAKVVRAAGIRPLQKEINLNVRGYRFEWEVNVVREKQVNAFCLPGGKIIVYTGILRVADDESQLAAILSHEIAHALAHHASERLARDRTPGLALLRNFSFERGQTEADHIGLFLMTFAGYDPEEAVRFWERMEDLHRGAGPPEILSDHPSDARRIRDLKGWVPQARAAKQAYDEGRVVTSD